MKTAHSSDLLDCRFYPHSVPTSICAREQPRRNELVHRLSRPKRALVECFFFFDSAIVHLVQQLREAIHFVRTSGTFFDRALNAFFRSLSRTDQQRSHLQLFHGCHTIVSELLKLQQGHLNDGPSRCAIFLENTVLRCRLASEDFVGVNYRHVRL